MKFFNRLGWTALLTVIVTLGLNCVAFKAKPDYSGMPMEVRIKEARSLLLTADSLLTKKEYMQVTGYAYKVIDMLPNEHKYTALAYAILGSAQIRAGANVDWGNRNLYKAQERMEKFYPGLGLAKGIQMSLRDLRSDAIADAQSQAVAASATDATQTLPQTPAHVAVTGQALSQTPPASIPPAPPRQNYFTGDGGKGIRIAVLEPAGKGLSADELWMLSLVQGSVTGDFNKYSAMTVIDRQNLEKVFAEWKESMEGHYSDEDRVKIGNLTTANHILTGNISKTANAFMLELAVTDVASGERKASYTPTPVSPAALEDLSALRTASADLLKQLGVSLTEAAQGELKQAASVNYVQAQTMLSHGIAAQKQGTEVAALSYFQLAAAFDPSLVEASKRSSVVSANISSGNIGADVRNDILWRKNWVARLAETEETFYKIFKAADPPYTLYYSTDIKTGDVNYQTETVELSIWTKLSANRAWFNAIDKSLQATAQVMLNGLNATNRKKVWGLEEWPNKGVSNTNPFGLSNTKPPSVLWPYNITAAFELVNQQGVVVGNKIIELKHGFAIIGDMSNSRITITFANAYANVNFNAVKASDITDNMTVRARVASINGTSPKNARFVISPVIPVEKTLPIVDNRDGKRYNTVRIGLDTWMAENLNYSSQTGNSYDYGKYGRRYYWNTAMNVCPTGWHLPESEEWAYLVIAAGGDSAGTKLKAKDDWDSKSKGTDDYGFSALPGGGGFGALSSPGFSSVWWTATSAVDDYHYLGAIPYYLGHDFKNAIVYSIREHRGVGYSKEQKSEDYGASICYVRCVQD
jgi:uncharacterized protein (TIGR02145 family)